MPSKNTIHALGALSNDLYRVALLLNRESNKAAEKFIRESAKRILEVNLNTVKPYIRDLIINVKKNNEIKTLNRDKADDYLMYSIQLQNYVSHNMTTN